MFSDKPPRVRVSRTYSSSIFPAVETVEYSSRCSAESTVMDSYGSGGKKTATGHCDMVTRPQEERFDPRAQPVPKKLPPTREEHQRARQQLEAK